MAGENKPDLVGKAIDKTIDVVADIVETWAKKKISESPAPAPKTTTPPPSAPLRAHARLRVMKGATQIGEYVLGAAPVVLGRNNLDRQDRTISRRHAQFFFRDGTYYAADAGSSNGTFVNGEKISAPHPLQNGDQIQIGGTLIVFELNAGGDAS